MVAVHKHGFACWGPRETNTSSVQVHSLESCICIIKHSFAGVMMMTQNGSQLTSNNLGKLHSDCPDFN